MSPVRHRALTVVAPIAPGKELAVDAWLRDAKRELQRALKTSATTHFARWVVLPPSLGEDGQLLGDGHQLAFESNFDGELSDHVAELRTCLGPMLDDAFRHVRGYPGSDDLQVLVGFFRASSLRTAAYYVAHGGLSVPVIRGDAALRRAVEARLGELSRGSRVQSTGSLELARDLQRVARSRAAQDGLTLGHVERGLDLRPPSVWARALSRPLSVLAAFLLAPLFELRDEWIRKRQPRWDTPALRAQRDLIGREEDRVDQNGLTHLVAIKPGWYRAFALRVMVYLVTALADAGALTGRLGGIQTIHFARWVAMPDGRLLFFSNYDGSWEAYLGEFIDKAAVGLTMIWTHTVWYPKTRWLLLQGAKDEAAFKAWTRAHQVPTQVWYSAYPGLSVGEVLKNAEIRELLGAELSAPTAERLLQLL
ncbi:MAG: hypothetical protein EOO73_09780 [Myxococcales bacterium]|nr:MAG: hypothetical protein EOO73_09780 [Myxococcales bacterium]